MCARAAPQVPRAPFTPFYFRNGGRGGREKETRDRAVVEDSVSPKNLSRESDLSPRTKLDVSVLDLSLPLVAVVCSNCAFYFSIFSSIAATECCSYLSLPYIDIHRYASSSSTSSTDPRPRDLEAKSGNLIGAGILMQRRTSRCVTVVEGSGVEARRRRRRWATQR